MTDAELRDRVDDLRQWMRSRIDECRRQEVKFSTRCCPPQALIDAWTERRTLQAVQLMLGDEP